jgi:hypothetical protein
MLLIPMNLIEEPDMLGIQEHIDRLPSNSRLIRILGVHYLHAEIEGDEDNTTGDLYLTRYGVRDLLPLYLGIGILRNGGSKTELI